MRFRDTCIAAIGYELGPVVVTSRALEQRLAPLYADLRLQPGQVEALTGIRERRYWQNGQTMSNGAVRAGRKALDACDVSADDIGMLIYAGVCRDQLEPATACAVADGLKLPADTQVYDLSNACLGVLNGMVQIANAVALGHVRAGMVVSCESARTIVDRTIERMLADRSMENYRLSLATLTGGSGAIAVIVSHADLAPDGHRLLGGVARTATQHHGLCRWWPDSGAADAAATEMRTDATAVMEHGVALGVQTWRAFLTEAGWTADDVDRVICHQVGAPHRQSVLRAIGLPIERDFQTFEFLGNIGTVSLPITAAIAEQRGFLSPGQRVGLLGIGSGLNCLMLGVQW